MEYMKGSGLRLLFALVALLLSGCVTSRDMLARTGQVIDWDTKEPIAGAIVVASWHGTVGKVVQRQSTCYHVESTMTDDNGQYRMPVKVGGPVWVADKTMDLMAYKAGYRESRDEQGQLRGRHDKDGVIYLGVDRRDRKQRFSYVRNIHMACSNAGTSETELLSVWTARYLEAKELAELESELRWVKYLRKVTASFAVPDSNELTREQREALINKYMEDNLP